MRKKLLALAVVGFAILAMADSCQSQTQSTWQSEQTAADKWGSSPNIVNYWEYQQEKQIYELRDNPHLVMNAYLFSDVTGKLTCLGRVVGFGVPYSTSWSQPTDSGGQSIPEPNGLFPSMNTNADWVQLIGPDGKPHVSFVEPNLIISDVALPCAALGR